MAFQSQQKLLADALKVAPPTVGAWMRGGDMRLTFLKRLYELGINVNWLLDDDDEDTNHMFADTPAGQSLRARVYLNNSTPIVASAYEFKTKKTRRVSNLNEVSAQEKSKAKK